MFCSASERCHEHWNMMLLGFLSIYWLISNDSKWKMNQSCMMWRFFSACTAVSNLVLEMIGGQAGRWGREDKGCFLTSKSTHACWSLVGLNIFRMILKLYCWRVLMFKLSTHHLFSINTCATCYSLRWSS